MLKKWERCKSLIWEYGITEDFVPVYNSKDKKYYGFFTYGATYLEQKLGLATSNSPTGKFSVYRDIPLSPLIMRLGSVIYPCELTSWKWRLYCVTSPTNFFNWNIKRQIRFLESDDLINWKIGEVTDVEAGGLLGQPCCHTVNEKFLMLATEIKLKNARPVEDVINAYFSKDGIHFEEWRSNPLIQPKPGTNYSKKAGNPSFIVDGDLISIFFEAQGTNEISPVWKIFQAEWDGKNEARITNEPIFSKPAANPYITKFDKHYLYYGALNLEKKKKLYKVEVTCQK